MHYAIIYISWISEISDSKLDIPFCVLAQEDWLGRIIITKNHFKIAKKIFHKLAYDIYISGRFFEECFLLVCRNRLFSYFILPFSFLHACRFLHFSHCTQHQFIDVKIKTLFPIIFSLSYIAIRGFSYHIPQPRKVKIAINYFDLNIPYLPFQIYWGTNIKALSCHLLLQT